MMPVPTISPNLTAVTGTSVTHATSGTAASITVPINTNRQNLTNALSANDHLSLWLLVVSGVPVYILDSGVGGSTSATTSNACLPVGAYGPMKLTPGAVISFITAAGTGSISIIKCSLV